MPCRFCGGTGVRYRKYSGRSRCLACDGTGHELPRWNQARGGRPGETTRAATVGGPTREHGGPGEAEEKSTPTRGTRKVAAATPPPTTAKEER